MKEPWKKTCNGKVIITLNDEKTQPTEVEVPVDLSWTNRTEYRSSGPKTFTMVATVLVLGLTIVTLFKVQNLVYSTSYINWRMQELEAAVGDSNDDVKLIKYKLSLDEREDMARAEPLIASISSSKNIEPQLDSQDLKLSESKNAKLTNSLSSETKDSKNIEVHGASKAMENANSKSAQTEGKTGADATDLNDGRDHPNPTDPEEWIKPLVETFDIFGNQPIEEHFIQNVLMKLLMPENNIEVVEFNKMQDNSPAQEEQDQKMIREKERPNRPLLFPIESMLMKNLLPPVSYFKIFHLNEKQEQTPEEDVPKQSIKLKLLSLLPPQEEFGGRRDSPASANLNNNNNLMVIRLNEEPSQEVEAPKMPMQVPGFNHLPIPIQDIIMKTIFQATSKNIESDPLHAERQQEEQQMQHPHVFNVRMNQQQQEKFNPVSIPIQDLVMKTLMPPPNQNEESQYDSESQDQSTPDVEVTKIPLRAMKIPFPLPIPEALMKSMLPVSNYHEPLINMSESNEDVQMQQQEQQPQEQQAQQTQEEPRAMARSTKLSPVEMTWSMAPPQPQYPNEPIQA